jgi:hydrogenase maturation protease
VKVVVGVGNALAGDDAAGLEVARRVAARAPGVRVVECEGEPVAILDALRGADVGVVVDATRSGAAPGTVLRVDAAVEPIPAAVGSTTTHLLGLADALELGRALESLPPRTVVYGIEGRSFDAGAGLAPEVEAVLDEVADAVLRELGAR